MADDDLYDFAFSFAGEHRQYVEATRNACEALGLKVFYDRDMNNEWWGKNFIVEQRKVYGSRTKYFVPFISTEYLTKPIPTDEFQAAMMTAVKQGDGYILPVLIGNVEVPVELLHPHIHYLKADDYSPEQLAQQMQQRLGGAGAAQPAREIVEVVNEVLALPMPNVVPQSFSKYKELRVVFDFLAAQFERAVAQLNAHGFVGTVEKLERKLIIRIERSGQTVYALDINRGGNMGDDKLEFALDQNRLGGGGINGWAEPYFDKDAGAAKLDMMDLSILGNGTGQSRTFTKEEFFVELWKRIVKQLEDLPDRR
ncbi:TIR domain-containing protein [Cryptosporangium sp. NPDC051539]|uniref:TIR domain-containing protein n=1 Tax=Cryptosporangium sp. NPDC051539 TaxID=3363962 RepID=UPI0037AFD61A